MNTMNPNEEGTAPVPSTATPTQLSGLLHNGDDIHFLCLQFAHSGCRAGNFVLCIFVYTYCLHIIDALGNVNICRVMISNSIFHQANVTF